MKKSKILSIALCAVMTFSALSVPAHAEGTTTISAATAQAAKNLTAPKVSVKSADESSVTLSWKAIDGAEEYQIYYSTKKNGTYKKYGTTAKTAVTVGNLKANTTYYFRVRAIAEINGETVKSGYSKKKSRKTESASSADETLRVTREAGKVKNNSEAELTIQGKPNTEYRISVFYSTKRSEAAGLENATTDSKGTLTWIWKVGARTRAGEHKIEIEGGGDKITTSFETYK